MEETLARAAVPAAGLRLLQSGLVARTWGNVSCRTGQENCIITPSGMSYESMRPEDTVLLSIADGSFAGMHKPSSEKGVHLAAYRRFPDAGFVIHTHQVYGTALSLAGFDTLAFTEEDQAFLGGVALAAYAAPGTDALTQHVADAMTGGAHTVLMAHHGCLFAGKNADEAFARAARLEAICKRACRGVPVQPAPDEACRGLAAGSKAAAADTALIGLCQSLAKKLPGVLGYTESPAVRAAADAPFALTAQLDDMAMMIGGIIPKCGEQAAALTALKTFGAALLPGHGALVCGATEADTEALLLLTEKACIAALHTHALGVNATLSESEIEAEHSLYVGSYAKQYAGGKAGQSE